MGRFLSLDPLQKKYPELTPYQFASNTPIMGVDLDGKELFIVHGTNQGNTPILESNKGVVFGDSKESNKVILDQFKRISGNTVSNDQFRWHAPITNNQLDRAFAAYQLVSFIVSERQFLLKQKLITEDEPISILGYSNGGNVGIQASNILNKTFGVKINLITLSTPAHRSFILPDAEDPRNSSGINNHVHITHDNDAVWFWATGLPSYPPPSDNYYIQEREVPLKGGIGSHTDLPGSPELGRYLKKIPSMTPAPKPTGLDKAIKEKKKESSTISKSSNE